MLTVKTKDVYGLGDLKKRERVYFEDLFIKRNVSNSPWSAGWYISGEDLRTKRVFYISNSFKNYQNAKRFLKSLRSQIGKDEIHYFERFEFSDGLYQGKIKKELVLTKNWYKRFLHAMGWYTADHYVLKVW